MKLREIFSFLVQRGREVDLRGLDGTEAVLTRNRREYESLSAEAKRAFDVERLSNPFGDARVVLEDPGIEVGGLLVGIDTLPQDLLTFYRLRKEGWRLDAVFSHHIIGPTYKNVEDYNFVDSHTLSSVFGIPSRWAEEIEQKNNKAQLEGKRTIEQRRFIPRQDSMDFAKDLGISLMCVHTPADNHLCRYIYDLIQREGPKHTNELIELINAIPEYGRSRRESYAPARQVTGAANAELGNVFLGLTNALALCAWSCMKEFANAGINTILGVPSDKAIDDARECGINLISLPHHASDSVGINLLLDKLVAKEPIDILCCGGFWRIDRSHQP